MLVLYNALIAAIPYLIDIEMELTQRHHLKEEGYEYALKKHPILIILKEFKRYMLYFVPIWNLWNLFELLLGNKYEQFSEKKVEKMLKRGEIKPIEELNKIKSNKLENKKNSFLKVIAYKERTANLIQTGELSKKSLISQANIINMMAQSDKNNITQTFSELTTDEKIEILLKELELLYEKKAEEMEINLEEEIQSYRKELKKELKSEELSKKL